MNGFWRVDWNIIVLKLLFEDNQPSDLEMQSGELCVRIYDMPFKLKLNAIAKKLREVYEGG